MGFRFGEGQGIVNYSDETSDTFFHVEASTYNLPLPPPCGSVIVVFFHHATTIFVISAT